MNNNITENSVVKFQFFGNIITVIFEHLVKIDDDNVVLGYAEPWTYVIHVSLYDPHDNPIPEKQIKTTIVHEMVHLFLDSGEYGKYSNNEPMVEWLAKCITEMLSNSKFNNLMNNF